MSSQKVLGKYCHSLARAFLICTATFSSSLYAYEYVDDQKLADASSIADALSEGTAELDFRLRYEDARQSEPSEQGAQALTLRSRLSYQTQRYMLFSGFIQFDDLAAIPNDENYNSSTNGQLDDVLIGEPDETRVSEVWLNYDIANTSFTFGRQAFELDAGRMIGSDSWYQNEQVFTGLSVTNQSLNYTKFTYVNFDRVEQPYAKYSQDTDADLKARLFHLSYNGFLLNDLSLYHLTISDHKRDRRWETQTSGIYFSGMVGGNNGIADSSGNREGEDFSISYLFEFATQGDKGQNPINYRASYSRIQLVAGYQGGGFTIARERLGADGSASFVTPLASMHEYQGYTGQAVDQTLGNVTGGIVDTVFGVSYRCSDDFSIGLAHHDYEFDKAPGAQSSIGTELQAEVKLKFHELSFTAKYADYNADALGEDTRRIWLQTGLSF